jgi:hypothetical protein
MKSISYVWDAKLLKMKLQLLRPLFTAMIVLFVSSFTNAQSNQEFPYTGTYQLLPNSKVSYAYDKVTISNNSFTLYAGQNILGVYVLTGYSETNGFKVEPAANTGSSGSESTVIHIKMSLTEDGKLYTLVSGQGANAEHYFVKID